MNKIEIIADAEQMAKQVLMLPVEAQDEFFREVLPSIGFNHEEIETVQKYVGYFKLLTNNRHYQDMKEACGLMLWNSFNQAK